MKRQVIFALLEIDSSFCAIETLSNYFTLNHCLFFDNISYLLSVSLLTKILMINGISPRAREIGYPNFICRNITLSQ